MFRAVLLILLAAGGALWWYRDDARRMALARAPFLAPYLSAEAAGAGNAPRVASSVPVVVAAVERRSVPVTIDAVGTVQAIASIALKPRIDSQIATINVKEGALVKENDLLMTLDSRAIRAQLAQAEAVILKDKAQIEQARRDLARAEELLAKRISTEVQRDTAATNLKVLQAQLSADEANRDTLAANVTYTEIRSPVSGRIGSILLKVGNTVRAADAQAIATVNQVDPIYVVFAVPQSLFGDLRDAMGRGKVAISARLGQTSVPGTVAYVENTVDLATGTVLAKAEMANAGEQLWPGAFVGVQATLGIESGAIAIPSAAVQIGQQGAYVFVVRDGKAKLTTVTVARTAALDTVISQGLKEGEQVVVDGQLRLVDGAAVQVQQQRSTRDGVATGNEPGPPAQRRS